MNNKHEIVLSENFTVLNGRVSVTMSIPHSTHENYPIFKMITEDKNGEVTCTSATYTAIRKFYYMLLNKKETYIQLYKSKELEDKQISEYLSKCKIIDDTGETETDIDAFMDAIESLVGKYSDRLYEDLMNKGKWCPHD